MRVLVGLGNPGEEYERTRHNAGFWLLDAIADHLGADSWRAFKGGEVAEVQLGGQKHLLFRPMQYMNRSGEPIRQLLEFYKLSTQELCIAADDVYIIPGSARIRRGGGDGGHNGWKSIMALLADDTFWRVRIGAGPYEQHPLKRRHLPPLDAYVLQPMPTSDQEKVDHLIDSLVPKLVQWLEHGDLSEETFHAI